MEGNGLFSRDPSHSVDWNKAKDNLLDEYYKEPSDRVRINNGKESSSWNVSNSVDLVKTEVVDGPSAQDPEDSIHRIQHEEGAGHCTMDHPDLVIKQIKIEEDMSGTETQVLTTFSMFEDMEKPLATKHQKPLEGQILERYIEGNWVGPETENVQMNRNRGDVYSNKNNHTVGGQGLPPELEKKLTLLYHRVIPHTECWESCTNIACFRTRQSTDMTLYRCTFCEKSFLRHSHFMTHIKMHTKDTPFPCSICGECFNSNHILIKHKKSHTQRRYKCTECDKTFTENSKLKYHVKTHTGEKPYKCPECMRSFIQHSDLRRHQRIHTGEKPYKCKECKKTFIQSSDLKMHQRIHALETHHMTHTDPY